MVRGSEHCDVRTLRENKLYSHKFLEITEIFFTNLQNTELHTVMSFDLSFILRVSSCGAEISKLLTSAVKSFKNRQRLAVVWALVMFHCHIVGDFELFYGACLDHCMCTLPRSRYYHMVTVVLNICLCLCQGKRNRSFCGWSWFQVLFKAILSEVVCVFW